LHKYCTPPKELRAWLEQEARLHVNESAILVQALDRYRWQQGADEEKGRGAPTSDRAILSHQERRTGERALIFHTARGGA
jgi:hypothetical protein